MNDERIKQIATECGFKLNGVKDGKPDLKDYVYQCAQEIAIEAKIEALDATILNLNYNYLISVQRDGYVAKLNELKTKRHAMDSSMLVRKIYELIDTSDKNNHYSLGVFVTLDDAMTEINNASIDNLVISEYAEEREEISIKVRAAGWSEGGVTVFKLNRERYLDEASGKHLWRKIQNN